MTCSIVFWKKTTNRNKHKMNAFSATHLQNQTRFVSVD